MHLGQGKGLGRHLLESLPYAPVIVGVAKNPLAIAGPWVPLLRARSRKPLYISAIGCPPQRAAEWVLSMHGDFRIPTLLRLAKAAEQVVERSKPQVYFEMLPA